MTYDPRLDETANALQNQLNQKANASTVGGLATAVNAKASQSDLAALLASLEGKADASAVSTALAGKAASGEISALSAALAGKADASALAAKADASALTALADTVPTVVAEMPLAEATTASPGVDGKKVPGVKHQHPRLSSATIGTIGAGGTATVAFTRTFATPPSMVIIEVPGTAPPQSQPATFKVESWVMTGSLYTGCTVRAWRSQVLPTLTTLNVLAILTAVVTGVNNIVAALTGFNVFGASASGTVFSCVAIQRSDA